MRSASKYFILFAAILLATGCVSKRISTLTARYSPIPQTAKELDIPKYDAKHALKGYPYVYWHFCKQKEKQLGLESAELSGDSLIFRVWITNPAGEKDQPHGLIEIKHDAEGWIANLYALSVDFDANNLTETVTQFEQMEIVPRDDWDFIMENLFQLKFDSLPTDESIPGYYENDSGYDNNLPTYSFEYATKTQYRFYQYNNAEEKSEKFRQAKNVLKILELLDGELYWSNFLENPFPPLPQEEEIEEIEEDYGEYDEPVGILYDWRIDAGAFIPLGNLTNTLSLSPTFGFYVGTPLTEKYRLDLGMSFVILVNSRQLEYLLPDTALSGRASFNGTVGLWLTRTDIKENWIFDSKIGAGAGFLQTDIPKEDPEYEESQWYSAETFFLGLGAGIRKNRLGLSLDYYFVPYNAFKKNFKPGFGSQYLTVGTYYVF
ncbi:MAG: hypothetical protein LBE91_07780 [Tannerella sp.]|jgi:hypothetical protein|nr:hypothetical protein [Tannerella sp.]